MKDAVTAIALCHNVTPVKEEENQQQEGEATLIDLHTAQRQQEDEYEEEEYEEDGEDEESNHHILKLDSDDEDDDKYSKRSKLLHNSTSSNTSASSSKKKQKKMRLVKKTKQNKAQQQTYQASSPDEIALVKFTESVHLTLHARDITEITLKNPLGQDEVSHNHTHIHSPHILSLLLHSFIHHDSQKYEVLAIFPFTSETKRMGIIVKEIATGQITFYMKGADAVMAKIVQYNDWLEEECGNMAREGLRTLVFGKKNLTQDEYNAFAKK